MKILVIGGTGFIGTFVVKQLQALGIEVGLVTRGLSPTDIDQSTVTIFKGNRSRLVNLHKDIEAWQPDAVIDLIAYNSQDAWQLVQTFRDLQARIVLISSGDVYHAYDMFRATIEGNEAGELTEQSPLRSQLYPFRKNLNPDTPQNIQFYNYDKIPAERIVLAEPDVDYTILRIPAVYGPNDRQHLFASVLMPMLAGQPTIRLEEKKAAWKWTKSYVENVASAIVLAATREEAANKIYNVGSNVLYTELEWFNKLAELTGWDGKVDIRRIEDMPEQEREPLNYEQHLPLNDDLIRKELGYTEIVNETDGLKATIEYTRKAMADMG